MDWDGDNEDHSALGEFLFRHICFPLSGVIDWFASSIRLLLEKFE